MLLGRTSGEERWRLKLFADMLEAAHVGGVCEESSMSPLSYVLLCSLRRNASGKSPLTGEERECSELEDLQPGPSVPGASTRTSPLEAPVTDDTALMLFSIKMLPLVPQDTSTLFLRSMLHSSGASCLINKLFPVL